MEVAGPAGQINIDFNVGYGFTAIIVAFLGRLNPIGILFAGLVMALTYVGGELTQFMLNLPAAAALRTYGVSCSDLWSPKSGGPKEPGPLFSFLVNGRKRDVLGSNLIERGN